MTDKLNDSRIVPHKEENLLPRLSCLPSSPGVYLMKDAAGRVIYVGKAISLRNRIRSYFQSKKGMDKKTQLLSVHIADFAVITTDNEVEALILEDTLIKEHQPRYNIRLRDDKRHPYLKITAESFPRILVVRKRQRDKARYFGPYTDVKAMRKTLKLIRKTFPIRTCSSPVPRPTGCKPCLNYHIERCMAPCAGLASEEEYEELITGTTLLLEGKVDGLISFLQAKMKELASKELFEQAIKTRDQITALSHIATQRPIVVADYTERDVVGLSIETGRACAQVFFIRDGRLCGRETFYLRAPGDPTPTEVLSAFLTQYYSKVTTIPREILLPEKIEDKALIRWLASQRNGKVILRTPQRGKKRQLVKMATDNARYSLHEEVMRGALWNEDLSVLREMKQRLALSALPQRIEAFDISNIMGQQATGAMVVFEGGKPAPHAYRHFKVKITGKPDDYAMMAEILRRRLQRGLSKIDDRTGKFSEFPDLILIDGGKGHLNVAVKVIDEIRRDYDFPLPEIDLLALAKEREEIFLPKAKEPLRIPPGSPALLLLRYIRDEAHRFSIDYHRKLRRGRTLTSELDSISGVGPKRKAKLLRHFKSLERLRRATPEEIAALPGISSQLAMKILSALTQDRGEKAEG
ncbi:excinuclease ABC subunit UvrC [Candidatus Bipolaricaulota bacterium]|nr:excinuclease ABC subunit UvrC [Candidatus Bipolaricaulota bacterium]